MQLLKAKINLNMFLPHVQAYTIGSEEEGMLPEAAALSFIRNSVIAFAEKSGIITTKVKVDLQCGLKEYLIEEVSGETIIGIKSAKYRGFCEEDCGLNWNWGNVDFQFEDDILTICPAPSEDSEDALELELVVIPRRDACEVDHQFYTKWFDAIIAGALKEIHLMPNFPWSSVSRADYRSREFEDAISRASIRRVMKGHRKPGVMQANPDWMPNGCTIRRRW